MTELQIIAYQEQMDACRKEFEEYWNGIIKLEPEYNTSENQIRDWHCFRMEKIIPYRLKT